MALSYYPLTIIIKSVTLPKNTSKKYVEVKVTESTKSLESSQHSVYKRSPISEDGGRTWGNHILNFTISQQSLDEDGLNPLLEFMIMARSFFFKWEEVGTRAFPIKKMFTNWETKGRGVQVWTYELDEAGEIKFAYMFGERYDIDPVDVAVGAIP